MNTKSEEKSIATKSSPPLQNNVATSQLPSLLTQLNGGKVLDLSVIAAIETATTTAKGQAYTIDADNTDNEILQSTFNNLFTNHVGGKSKEDIINNAKRHAKDILDVEVSIWESNGFFDEERRDLMWTHPDNTFVVMSTPKCKVWLDIFLGEEYTNELLKDSVPMNNDRHGVYHNKKTMEWIIYTALCSDVSRLSSMDLLANILHYMRNAATKMDSMKDFFKFAAIYGFDGVMKDILNGSYGDIGDLTVNTLLPLADEEKHEERQHNEFRFLDHYNYLYPAYALGAILGHQNVVIAALKHLDGKIDCPIGRYSTTNKSEVDLFEHNLPSSVLIWVFRNNMQDMIKCLVNECGFQFRWIHHRFHIPKMIDRLFQASEYESHPKWTGGVKEQDWCYESKRERRQMRAEGAHSEQMKMLDLLVSLGFPFSLFFPVEPPIEREEALLKDKKLETKKEYMAFLRSLAKEERKARDIVHEACYSYNDIQSSKKEMLELGEFYRKLKSRWDGQESVQVDRLPDFEALDLRWTEKNDDEDEYDSYDSYDYDSDDY